MSEPETHSFQAETAQLLDLMIHSLYSHKEIFLRELISNASDALDKLRHERLVDESLAALPESEGTIELEPDAEARTLTIRDDGIGMTRDDLVANLGSIAGSGTRRFLDELKRGGTTPDAMPELIGQFGVGFYSAFMVSKRVVVETRRAGSDEAWRWSSSGDGTYTLEPCEREGHGTTVTLELSDLDEEEAGAKDYTQEWVLREVVKRYSDFVGYPIRMDVERKRRPTDDEGKPIEDAAEETVTETVTLNSQKPLWVRPKGEVSEEEHGEFYRHLTHDWEPPLEAIHFKAEGTTEYTALLYLPKRKPIGLFDPNEPKSKVQLYVRRVFITADCEELMPAWLRFVPGVVDSADLPLNVSRETLQHARQLGQIKKRLVRKVLDSLTSLLSERREDYEAFWGEFGPVLKEGLYYDDDFRTELAERALFRSSTEEGWTTLGEYRERMAEGQEAIYVLSAPDLAAAKRSAHLEAFGAKGYEVLFLTDQVDEFAFQRLQTFEELPFRAIDKGDVDLGDDEAKKAREEREKQDAPLLEAIKEALDEHVDAVRFSSRLTDSPAVLVTPEHGLAPHVERLMRDSGQAFGMGATKRTLELNPDHPLTAKLSELREAEPERFRETCELLHGQACLAEGSPLPDPARFAKLLTERL